MLSAYNGSVKFHLGLCMCVACICAMVLFLVVGVLGFSCCVERKQAVAFRAEKVSSLR